MSKMEPGYIVLFVLIGWAICGAIVSGIVARIMTPKGEKIAPYNSEIVIISGAVFPLTIVVILICWIFKLASGSKKFD